MTFVVWEIAESPDNDRSYKDDASHLLEILLTFLPRVAPDGFRRRPAIRRQFHDERRIFAFDDE